MDMVRKGFGNKPLKDLTMDRGRELRNLKSLLMKIGDESILFFSKVSLSKILSGNSLSFVGKRGIYTRVKMECEESGFSKQGWLAA